MKVNETFLSLQGEGYFTGTPAFFLRFSGCNLQCPFCDTQHQSFAEMNEEEIVCEASRHEPRHIVITGGEPALQLTQSLVDKLHEAGLVETDGTFYVLNKTAESGLGFYKLASGKTIDAGKAYLTYSGSGALAKEFFGFDESSADGIGSIDNGQLTIDNEGEDIYTLDGRRLQGKPTTKGIYIVNGKKTVVK